MGIGIFRGFDVNAIRGAGRGTQKTADTFFQAIFVAMQHVNSAITRLKVYRLFGIAFRHGFPEHSPESNAKSVEHGPKSVEDFANRRCHAMSLANDDRAGKPEVFKRLAHVSP
jgi:phage-related protein